MKEKTKLWMKAIGLMILFIFGIFAGGACIHQAIDYEDWPYFIIGGVNILYWVRFLYVKVLSFH